MHSHIHHNLNHNYVQKSGDVFCAEFFIDMISIVHNGSRRKHRDLSKM